MRNQLCKKKKIVKFHLMKKKVQLNFVTLTDHKIK